MSLCMNQAISVLALAETNVASCWQRGSRVMLGAAEQSTASCLGAWCVRFSQGAARVEFL